MPGQRVLDRTFGGRQRSVAPGPSRRVAGSVRLRGCGSAPTSSRRSGNTVEPMSADTEGIGGRPPIGARWRWMARGALLTALAAVLLPLLLTGLRSLPLLVLGGVGITASAAGAWWAVSRRGVRRTLGVIVVVVGLLSVVIAYTITGFLPIAIVSAALLLLAGYIARATLRACAGPVVEYETAAPAQPFIIMNPRSGGGKVVRFHLAERAEALGARVTLLEGDQRLDVVALARDAVADGADLLGVAGGDGTQALVAGVAADHGIPFLVVSAGTRNHFALDLGLDRHDPSRCLDALADGVEIRVDLGTINGRPFVNNASFGAYAELVRQPEYRDDKGHTALQLLPDLLIGHARPVLYGRAGDVVLVEPQALLVSNNPYGVEDPAGLDRRERLDRGVLGVISIRVENAAQATRLLSRAPHEVATATTATSVTVYADAPEIPVGVDGESIVVSTPVQCAIRPAALRVRVPRNRPGQSTRPPLDRRGLGAVLSIALPAHPGRGHKRQATTGRG
jgi:diacylglycerol kinase family enzyme